MHPPPQPPCCPAANGRCREGRRWRYGVLVPLVPASKASGGVWPHLCCPSAVFWAAATLATFSWWGWLTIRWWPRDWATWHVYVVEAMIFTSHLVFMDLVPNWLTALALHRVGCLLRPHRWEHRQTKSGRLSSVLMISTLYAWYTLCWMFAWGLVVGCTSPSGEGCLHWEATMWAASWSYSLAGLLLRLTLWSMRHYQALHASSLLRKLSRFYWAHFAFEEWSGGVVFGAVTPFYDVLFGTCPFDIRWSVPVPLVDFLVCDEAVFRRMKHPRAVRWSVWQWAWHLGWAALIVLLLGSLAAGQVAGWFEPPPG